MFSCLGGTVGVKKTLPIFLQLLYKTDTPTYVHDGFTQWGVWCLWPCSMTAVQVYFTPRLYRPDGSGVVYSILLVQVPEGGVLPEESSDQRTPSVPYSHRNFKLIARGRGGGRE